MSKSKFIDAKELAGVVELDARHIRRPSTQRRLGLAGARDKCCERPVRWHRKRAADALRAKGYDAHFDEED